MKKLIKNEICGSVNSTRIYCSKKMVKVAVTVHVPYMNNSRLWGKKAWKKKKKKEEGRNWIATQQTTNQTHTIKAICRLDYTFYYFPAFLFLIWFFLQHSVFLLWVEFCLIRLVDGAAGLLACLTSILFFFCCGWVLSNKTSLA